MDRLKAVKTAFRQDGWSPCRNWKLASPELETHAVCSSETCCTVKMLSGGNSGFFALRGKGRLKVSENSVLKGIVTVRPREGRAQKIF